MKQAPVLSEMHIKRVLQHCTQTAFPKRNRCAFMLGWLGGMRICEVAALCVGDVLGRDGEIRREIQLRASQTKGSEACTVLVNSQLRSELEIYVDSLSETRRAPDLPLIFSKSGKRFSANGLCQVMLNLYDGAGLDRVTSHSPRRTFITTLAHKGINVRTLAALARHRHISTTQRYIDTNELALRAAIELI